MNTSEYELLFLVLLLIVVCLVIAIAWAVWYVVGRIFQELFGRDNTTIAIDINTNNIDKKSPQDLDA